VSSATHNGYSKIHHVSFIPYLSFGKLCKKLNTTVGQGIWYDTFQARNTKWLWLVNNIVTKLNSNNVLGVTSRRYTSYVAQILNSVKNRFLCCAININYAKYIKQCIAQKKCTFKLRTQLFRVIIWL